MLLLALVAALVAGPGCEARAVPANGDASPGTAATAAPDAGVLRAGRELLQTAEQCNATIRGCVACRFQRFGGTTTRTVCTACDVGYEVKNSGRACWCAAGFYWDPDVSSWQCQPCGTNFYCPGSRLTQASGSARLACGANKITTTTYASSDRECVVRPGYGWAPGDDSGVCPQGFYNPGYNTRRCALCPGGLTTQQEGSLNVDACVAPAGSYYQRGRAVACARGTYKSGYGLDDCTPCPEGFSTVLGLSGMTDPDNCTYVLPGYTALPGLVVGTAPAARCPEDTYRGGDALYDPAVGVNCTACPSGMQTVTDGATTEAACLVPPGKGYNATAHDAYECPLGTYNEGWNRRPCSLCGNGSITTASTGSTAPDDCYTPAGHMAYKLDGGTLFGEICPIGTFGSGNNTYGLVTVACMSCGDGMTTAGQGSTSTSQCYTLPGYGYDDGGAFPCEYGYWSAGGGQDPCNYCGYGYNTTANRTVAGPAIRGATSADDCVVAQGYTLQASGAVAPCPQGAFKPLFGAGVCTTCPDGTSTTVLGAASGLADCDACQPGYGTSVPIDPAAPTCALCASGSYSPGRVSGGKPCTPCPKPQYFTGDMVTRIGAWTPEACFPEFPTDATRNSSTMTWDFIPMDAAALTTGPQTTADDCQAACAANDACQYFEFRTAPAAACLLRDKVPYSSAVNVTDPSASYVLFEIAAGRYVAYNAHATDAASLGKPLGSYADLADALVACDAAAACIGLKFDSTAGSNPWATFGGALWEGTTGKVHVIGANIDSWVKSTGGR